jgi:Uma2 family endonuclease
MVWPMDQISFESTTFMTQDQFECWVHERERWDSLHHYELLNGRVVMNPPAGYPHGLIGSSIQRLLGLHVATHALGIVCDSSQGFALPTGDTVEPDHSYISMERWRKAPRPEEGKFLRVVPDLIVEVLSLGTASRDRGEKKAIYERNGVREYWLVDARERTLVVFHLFEGRFGPPDTYDESDRFRSKVLPNLEFSVSELFP